MTVLTWLRAAGAFALIGHLLGGSAAAQVHQGARDPLIASFVDREGGVTLAELLARGMEHEPNLQAVRLEATAASRRARQAGARPNPMVSIERRQELSGMDRQLMTTMEWPLELFRRGPRVSTAKAEAARTETAVTERERTSRLEIESQYGRVLASLHHLEVLYELATASKRTLQLLEARTTAGAAPRVDRDAAALDAGRFEAQRALVVGSVQTELLELKRLVGLEPSAPLKVRETLEEAVAAGAAPLLLEGPAMARADVREALADVEVARARGEQLRTEGRFDVALMVGYSRMNAGFPQRAVGVSGALEPIRSVFHNAAFGALVTVPLFNRNQGAIAAATSTRAAAERTVAARRLLASTDLVKADARLRAARAALDLFNGPLREAAKRNLDVSREAYELGRTTMLDVLTEHRRFLELEMTYSDALAEAFFAHATLRAAGGNEK
jgi:outer membrane protein, heavy metal efflux system